MLSLVRSLFTATAKRVYVDAKKASTRKKVDEKKLPSMLTSVTCYLYVDDLFDALQAASVDHQKKQFIDCMSVVNTGELAVFTLRCSFSKSKTRRNYANELSLTYMSSPWQSTEIY